MFVSPHFELVGKLPFFTLFFNVSSSRYELNSSKEERDIVKTKNRCFPFVSYRFRLEPRKC